MLERYNLQVVQGKRKERIQFTKHGGVKDKIIRALYGNVLK